jgi:hypothetical protein
MNRSLRLIRINSQSCGILGVMVIVPTAALLKDEEANRAANRKPRGRHPAGFLSTQRTGRRLGALRGKGSQDDRDKSNTLVEASLFRTAHNQRVASEGFFHRVVHRAILQTGNGWCRAPR